jgi:hypothetical protein
VFVVFKPIIAYNYLKAEEEGSVLVSVLGSQDSAGLGKRTFG